MLESFLTIATHQLLWIFIGLTVVFFGVQGLVGRSAEAPTAPDDRIRLLAEKVGMTGLHPVLFLILVLTWGIVAGTLFAGLYAILWQVIFHAPPEGAENVWNWRFTLAQLVALTTVLGAVIALPITINRLILTRRQTDTVEQGHITDRINKAVEGLGAEKTVKKQVVVKDYSRVGATVGSERTEYATSEHTEPNLEVRIGAIYALERIAQDSDRDHVQIMEILCAYIRQNAPASDAVDWPELEMKEGKKNGPLQEDWLERLEAFHKAQEEAKKALTCRTDIQAALTVIGRRSAEQRQIEAGPGNGEKGVFPFDIPYPEINWRVEEPELELARLVAYSFALDRLHEMWTSYSGYQLDLCNTNLQGAELSGVNLHGAQLSGARMQGTVLQKALLGNVNLREARLQGADLREARLQLADLQQARLNGASLEMAQLQQAGLGGARLQGVNLELVEIDEMTSLSAASFAASALRMMDYTNIPQIAEHLEGMFGDGSVTLPEGVQAPVHWPTFELDDDQFHKEWRKWQDEGPDYTPPKALDEE